ncbi:MAG: SBBP repeat-containing protein [Planctomycetes bacterium]|nr:SBBP repeat-containing protein [Planctomycetota bacterium]
MGYLNLFKNCLNILFCLVFFILLFTPVLTANEPATKPTSQEFKQKTAKIHMPFIANNGQMDEQIKFYAKTFGGTVFVTKEGEIVYALPMNSSELRADRGGVTPPVQSEARIQECRCELHSPNEISHLKRGDFVVSAQSNDKGVCNKTPNPYNKNETHPQPLLLEGRTGIALREEFVGAKVKAIQGEEPSVTKVSYFKGNDPLKWKTNISTYDAVNLGEIYDGIELKLRAYGNNVEKLFCINTGAGMERIRLRLSGGKDFNINNKGELEVETELGLVKFTKPVAYQEIEGKRVEVDVEYKVERRKHEMRNSRLKTNPKIQNYKLSTANCQLTNDNCSLTYGFKVASYDKSKDLIIDPLLASTYLGGYGNDYGNSLILDTSENIYVTGITESTDFPTTSGAYDTSFNGGSYDVFISKLDGGLNSLLASTYLGGSDYDGGSAIAFDTSGNVYVTGTTVSTNFPTTSRAYDTSLNGYYGDVFISKLDSGLTSLLASTYLGGSYYSLGDSLTLDTSGHVYVTGYTYSTDFPTTSGAYDTSQNGNGYDDVFISKLDGGLTSLLASTYLGGSNIDVSNSLTLDTSGNVYVMGYTDSYDFPTTSGAYDTSQNGSGSYDVFISKLNGGLTSLLASTYLGGSGNDYGGESLTLDTSGDVYVTGWTDSTDFPTTSGAYDTSQNGYLDVFISKLDGGLTNLLASTYLGGSSGDYGNSPTLDTSGDVYVTGETLSTDFPTTSGAYDTSQNGNYDVFISKLDGGLTSLLASTYLGGSYCDEGYAIALDTSGDVYVTGYTDSTDFPTSGVYDTSFNGGDFDVFIAKLDSNLSSSDTTAPTGSISIISAAEYTNTTSVTLNLSATDECGVTGYYVSTNPFTPLASDAGWADITTTTSYNEDVTYTLGSGDGSKSVYAWFKDIYDNVSSGASDSIVLDTTEPIVSITSPTPDDTYSTTSSTISLSGIAMDATSGLSSITWSNDKGGSSGTANGTTNWSISNISLSVGNNTITVTATDNAGNSSADTIIVTYTPYTPTPTATLTATPTPIICDEATDMEAVPDLLILKVKKSDTVIVTVTGENGCQVEGDAVRASVSDSSLISVAPQMQVTDENGEVRFKITANNKTGNVVVMFRDGSLSTKVSVRVVK